LDAAQVAGGYGARKADWNRLAKPLRQKRDSFHPQHGATDREPNPEAQPQLNQPDDDAQYNRTLAPLDEILAAVKAAEPPFRNLKKHYSVVVTAAFPIMHTLSSSTPTPRDQ
jgi:hypothetical protein